jgi:3-hydroxybutyryl-CoA dehydrogenase
MEIAVLGAGAHGRDLAHLLAGAGHTVRLQDEDAARAMDAVDAVGRAVDEETIERLDATTDREAAVTDAAVVVLASPGDPQAVRDDLATVEEWVDRDTVLVITVGDGSVTVAAAGLRQPDRAIGLELPDPLDAAVAELIVADQTSADTIDRIRSLVEDLEIAAAVVADHPGVVSTRLALVTEVEAMRILADGVATVVDVDAAFAKRHGHTRGPLERADRAGLDNRLAALETLADALGPRFDPPKILRDLVTEGHTGVASGRGFYAWENGEPAGSALPAPDLVSRRSGSDDPERE